MQTPLPPDQDQWLKRTELSARQGIPVKTLAMWASARKGPKYYLFGGAARYRLSDVIAWENAQPARCGTDVPEGCVSAPGD